MLAALWCLQARGSNSVGVTALALSPSDLDTFLVGSEGGLLLRCSFSSQKLATVLLESQSLPLRAPAVFSFRPSSGPIHSIHCSPFHRWTQDSAHWATTIVYVLKLSMLLSSVLFSFRNLFLSAGTDGMAHLYSLLQTNPLLSLRVSESHAFEVQWSPTRPLVFAAATGQGKATNG